MVLFPWWCKTQNPNAGVRKIQTENSF